MFNFAFNSLSEVFLMQSQNGQNHGIFVWSVVIIDFTCILVTFMFSKVNIKKISNKKMILLLIEKLLISNSIIIF